VSRPAVDKIAHQRGRERGVLGRALPEPERDLDPVGGYPEADDVGAALELDPVDHQHREADVVKAAAHEHVEILARPGDELAADRRLRGRA